jgi:hypothetical protein
MMTAHATIAPAPIDVILQTVMADIEDRSPNQSQTFARAHLLRELLAERGLVIVNRAEMLRARDRIHLATGALFEMAGTA